MRYLGIDTTLISDPLWRSFSDNINDVVLSASKQTESSVMLPLSATRSQQGHTHSNVPRVYIIPHLHKPLLTSFPPHQYPP